MSQIAPDAAARTQALDCSESFAVSAPAGSGKTELLIQRTLKLLSLAESPESILAITFTRKAAAEMRHRIVQALTDAKHEVPIEGEHQQHTRDLANAALVRDATQQWQLLENPNRLQLHTIDAFCRQIAGQLCLDTGISLPPNTVENPRKLYLNAAEAMFEHLEHDTETGQNLQKLCEHFDGNISEVAELLADMLSSRDSWLPLVFNQEILDEDYLQSRLIQIAEDRLNALSQSLAPYASDIELLLDYAITNQENDPSDSKLHKDLIRDIPPPEAEYLNHWKALLLFFCTAKLESFRKTVNVSNGFPPKKKGSPTEAVADVRKAEFKALTQALTEVPDLLEHIQRVAILPDPDIDTERLDRNRTLLQLLPTLAAQLKIQIRETGETDYADIALTALLALQRDGRPTSLALRLDYRIDHILVDEFQDTSSLQVHLLECLTEGWTADDGRTLFIVGDGMQSIYSFRKANVSLFIRARQCGLGELHLAPIDLTANFRSDEQVVGWVNQVFSEVLPETDDLTLGQVGFRRAIGIHAKTAEPPLTKGFSSPAEEAAYLAESISQTIESTEENIVILVRNRSHLAEILPALRDQGIDWHAQDIDPLANRMAVMDIHSLTRALCIPADRIAWLSILRAPWAGLDNADLLHVCQWQPCNERNNEAYSALPPSPIWQAVCAAEKIESLSESGKRILIRLRSAISTAFGRLGQASLRQIVESLWSSLDGEQGLTEGADKQDVGDYLDLLEATEVAGFIPDWQVFDERLDKLYAKPRASVSDKADAARVQIMTIHKSKGLEFDHVYLPALERTPRPNDNPLLLWSEPESAVGSLGYLISAKPAAGAEDELYQFLKAENTARSDEELARLLYVACTRARTGLTLTATISIDEKKAAPKKPAKRSMLAILWPQFEAEFTSGLSLELNAVEESLRTLNTLRRLPPSRDLQGDPIDEALTFSHFNTEEESQKTHAEQYSSFSANFRQRVLGNILHDTLMKVVRTDDDPSNAEKYMGDWARALGAQGFSGDTLTTFLDWLADTLARMLADDTGRWLLDNNHDESAAELEMDYFDNSGTLQRAVIDRTFIDQRAGNRATRWIVDYKSSSPQTGESQEAFLQRESNTYRPQLIRYSQLFEAEIPVRALLYFPAAGCHTEVDLSPCD